MLPHAHIDHHLPGRTRLRVPSRRGDGAYFARLCAVLDATEGLRVLACTPMTGSLLLAHAGQLHELGELAQQAGLFELDPGPQQRASVLQSARAAGVRMDQQLREASAGRLDLRALAVTGLLGASLFQLRRGQYFPSALALLLDAAELVRDWGRGDEARAAQPD